MIADYSGATARLAPERGLALDPRRWAWQEKRDGVYCQARTDRHGRISDLRYRSGQPVSALDADGLLDLDTGLPDAVLCGELEAQTEAGRRARSARGRAHLHLFDCSRWNGRYVAPLPYAERHGLLYRWQANIECYTGEQEYRDRRGNWHDATSGDFVRPTIRNLSRLPIVPLHRGKGSAEQLWRQHVELEGGEGLVAVRLDAPLGARAAKRKLKRANTLDCRILCVDGGVACVSWLDKTFYLSARGRWSRLVPGQVVEVRADGFYERGATPRFARIVRVREDLHVSAVEALLNV